MITECLRCHSECVEDEYLVSEQGALCVSCLSQMDMTIEVDEDTPRAERYFPEIQMVFREKKDREGSNSSALMEKFFDSDEFKEMLSQFLRNRRKAKQNETP